MTREEAAEQIYGLILSADDEEGPCIFSDQIEALETAIEVLKQTEQPTEVQDILQYLDEYLHPIISPEHWSVYSELYDMISMLPSVQSEQKKGKWIYPSGIVGFGRCSECKALWDYSLITNRFFRHCPRCGAKIENCPFKDTEREAEE